MEERKFRIAVVARMKHGVLYEAIKKRGWTVKKAAEFLGIRWSTLCSIINLKKKPPFLFSPRGNEETKRRARELTEKLMELTGMTVEDLFPEEFRTDEFLASPKIAERFADVPTQLLLEQTGMLALPPAPDEELMEKEQEKELDEVINGLGFEHQHAIQRLYFDGMTGVEAGKERGVGRGAVPASAKTALKKMKEGIEFRRNRERTAARRNGIEPV